MLNSKIRILTTVYLLAYKKVPFHRKKKIRNKQTDKLKNKLKQKMTHPETLIDKQTHLTNQV